MSPFKRYRDLPTDRTPPHHSAWGFFGDDDQVGTVNWLGPDQVRRAAALVSSGRVFSLNWDLEKPDPPLFNRQPMRHHVIELHPGADDYYDGFYPQTSSQWDALCHQPHPAHQRYYNGCRQEDITGKPGSRNGIEHWARRGIVGRFILIDVAQYRERAGRPIRHDETDIVTIDDLDATLKAQSTTTEPGDILLIRTGWMKWYEAQTAAKRRILSEAGIAFRAPGLEGEERTAEWLWDRQFSAVASDVPALEAVPMGPWGAPNPEETYDHFLHFRIIGLLGMAVGEMFLLDPLAQDCADDRRYTGLFTSAPLNKLGGVGSTANALAIK
jgi:kynurenine formamidase